MRTTRTLPQNSEKYDFLNVSIMVLIIKYVLSSLLTRCERLNFASCYVRDTLNREIREIKVSRIFQVIRYFTFISMTHSLCCVYLFTLPVIDVSPKEKEVTEGENVVINCSQSSSNSNTTGLNFTWSKLGAHTLLSNSSQLIITNVSRGDSGNYSCIATNGTANWSAVAIASITVLCKYTFSSL